VRIGQIRPRGLAYQTLLTVFAITLCGGATSAAAQSSRATKAAIKRIAKIYAQDSIQTGGSVGIEVGVVYGSEPPQFVSAGDATAGAGGGRKFTSNTIFQIGSVSKVFTTNLLGQSVANGSLNLSEPLSSFESDIGPLEPLTAAITLEELGDFTGGFPSYAEACGTPAKAGCLPSARPTIDTYTGQDFAEYFQTAVPRNFFNDPPTPVSTLPAPYNYSDYSIGLLGLLLGDQPNTPLSNAALTGWFDQVQSEILTPLGMNSTYLFDAKGLIASGYEPALATATVSNGEISAITVTSPGGIYSAPPRVKIVGGGGHGATAQATIDAGDAVNSISIVKPGTGYIAPASVIFTNGGSSTTANAAVVVKNGKVVAIKINGAGLGYLRVPTVTISGGRTTKGTDATAVANIFNGQVSYVSVTNGGSGYVPPLSVIVAPGAAASNNIPIWAPAGALSSSMRDMTTFAAAALGDSEIGKLAVPAILTQGFTIAETPYACAAEDPSLADCPAMMAQSALAWSINPSDSADGVGEVISKNGGIPGFSTQVMLMPSRGLAVVVFANSRQNVPDTGAATAEADRVARDILFALFYALP
jgi:CubicO group peptidase (beta-lactamase class C family)